MYQTTVTFTFINPLRVTFIVNDTVYQTVKVKKNETVDKPVDPEGNFLGWFINDTEYDFTTPVTENITLTAKFEAETVDIIYPDMASRTGIVYTYHGVNDAISDIYIYDTLERFSSISCKIVSNNKSDVVDLLYPYSGKFALNSKNYRSAWSKEENQTILQFFPPIKKSDLKTITFTYIN